MSLVVVNEQEATLDELREVVVRNHALVLSSLQGALHHALACGDALLAAKRLCPYGQWTAWLQGVELSTTSAWKYIRLSYYRDEIPPDVGGTVAAIEAIRMLPDVERVGTENREAQRRDALQLRAEGLSYRRVAATLGISTTKAHRLCEPEKEAEHTRKTNIYNARRRAAAKALREQERDRRISVKGGDIAEGYSLTRKALQRISRSKGAVLNREARLALGEAEAALDRAARKIDEAVRLS